MSGFSTDVILDRPFDEAVEAVTAALAAQGFGVISRIDLQKVFAEKLGQSFRRYTILGACNPGLANRVITARPDAGLLLPCNVTVEDTDSGTLVRLVDAEQMMGVGNLGDVAEIAELASDAGARLGRVAEALGEAQRKCP